MLSHNKHANMTQRQLMRRFVVKLILRYEQNVKVRKNFSKIKVCLIWNFMT